MPDDGFTLCAIVTAVSPRSFLHKTSEIFGAVLSIDGSRIVMVSDTVQLLESVTK